MAEMKATLFDMVDVQTLEKAAELGAIFALATEAANYKYSATVLLAQLNAKYIKPSGGIPKSDLAEAVRDSLDKALSALQQTDADLLKSLINAKYTKPSEGIPEEDLAQAVRDALNKALSALQPADAAVLQSLIAAKYTKPSEGIPKEDLAEAVRDALDKAFSALQPGDLGDIPVGEWIDCPIQLASGFSSTVGASGTSIKINPLSRLVHLKLEGLTKNAAWGGSQIKIGTFTIPSSITINASYIRFWGMDWDSSNKCATAYCALGFNSATPYIEITIQNRTNPPATANVYFDSVSRLS
ncbi:MAG: hypothetical protein LBC64_01890 [Fibromonadaceae bacterium]|jgi:hypothetical protein|nr:hypothetical protein [Fibromonadaceae bacterium]